MQANNTFNRIYAEIIGESTAEPDAVLLVSTAEPDPVNFTVTTFIEEIGTETIMLQHMAVLHECHSQQILSTSQTRVRETEPFSYKLKREKQYQCMVLQRMGFSLSLVMV